MLDATCNVVSAHCADAMSRFAQSLRDQANCGADFAAQNPIVLRAYNGFLSYAPMHAAGCLQADARAVSASPSNEYCFVAASGNASAPADQYLYYLPLGIPMPGGSRPTCSSCTQQTMRTFAQAAGNLTSPLAATYAQAATLVNQKCGPDWVEASVKPIQGSGPPSPNGAAANGAAFGMAGIVAAAAAAIVLA